MSTDEPSNQLPPMKHTNINVPSWQMTTLIDAVSDMQRHLHAIENHVWYMKLWIKCALLLSFSLFLGTWLTWVVI